MTFVPSKLYYKIREVCEIVGVEAHVLRFWETEFPTLTPPKSKSGQRTYRPKDIDLLLRIKTLLYVDGFTIAGARKRLNAEKVSVPTKPVAAKVVAHKAGPERLNKVKAELENILTLLDRE